MPRRDDIYYKAYPGLFLTSAIRTSLTRSQWAAYRDLIDLLRLNGGSVENDPKYLRHNLMADDADLLAVMACKHVYIEDGKVRHRIVDELMDDLDSAREWGAAMAAKREEKRASRKSKPQNKKRSVQRVDDRAVDRVDERPFGHTQTDRHSQSECAGAKKTAPRTAPLPAPLQGGPSAAPEPIYPKRKTKIGPDGLLYFADEPEVPA